MAKRLLWCMIVIGVAVFVGLAAGCANKRVTYSNYERIGKDMPMEEVEDILGKPSRRHHEDFYYEGRYGVIKIEAKRGVVHEKDWKDKH